MYQNCIPFYEWIIFHCIDILDFVYPVNSWWIFGLFLLFWLLWIMLLWNFLYKFLYEHMWLYTWRRKWKPTPVFLPGESHGWRSLVGYSPWGRKESDMTEWLHFTSLHVVIYLGVEGISGSFCNSINFLKNCQTFLQSSCTVSYSHRSNQSILKEISPGCSLEGLMLKLKLQYFGHLMQELTHWKRPWCWEGLGAGGEGEDRGWDGWMESRTRWTWVWVNSGSRWWTGRPGMLRFMGSQRVRHDWATELNWMGYDGARARPREATQRPRAGAVAQRSYPVSEVRSRGCALLERPWREIPHPRQEKPK